MRKYKKVKEIQELNRLDEITCDICGKKGKFAYEGETEWGNYTYEELTVTICMNEGNCYPEGGSGKRIYFDICPVCFRNKLIPLLESLGARAYEEEWDY